ncbi:folate-binding protein [Stenotrophomonas sp. YIM B06876]|uniref:CAF17-like 4Fe-4S cluster assembly/insertion protein YgfZ n=1 Tax=Stenotrophomonas sp. YIM B06876 TaxID=3060211 RepID=UPI00273905F6|nr:folate-binding protein [Stenotrophomonas sp. YIM B06876]
MSDNLPSPFSGFCTLATSQVVALSGADALAFAQAQFASDILALADGHWQWSTWLSAKGRVLSVFQLLRLDARNLLLLHHDGDAVAVVEQLRRFVFRRKLSISLDEERAVTAGMCAPRQAHAARIAQLDDATLELDVGAAVMPRTVRVVCRAVTDLPHDGDSDQALAWRQSDLRYGLPRLDPSQSGQWTPQQLGLDRLAAYSVRKGCYPGQEIVARTHFLGKAKRSLQLLQTCGSAVAGTAVTQHGVTVGTVASSAGALALAVLPLELEGTVEVDGHPAPAIALLDGLAR